MAKTFSFEEAGTPAPAATFSFEDALGPQSDSVAPSKYGGGADRVNPDRVRSEPAARAPRPEPVAEPAYSDPSGSGDGASIMQTPQARTSVLEDVQMDEQPFDSREGLRLSNRAAAEQSQPRPGTPSAERIQGKTIPVNEQGTLGRAGSLIDSQIDSYSAGLGYKLGDAADAVGLTGVGGNLRNRAGALQERADTTGKSVALSADGDFEKYAPQILAVFPTMAVAGLTGATLPAMFGIAEMQQYAEGRKAGLAPGAALTRSVSMGAAEVLGEKLGGTGKLIEALEKVVVNGGSVAALKELSGRLAASGMREIPSEEATFAMQFGIDKAPGIGLKPNAGVADFIEGAKDTAVVAAGAGGIMAGSSMATSRLAASAQREARIKQLRDAGETSVADILQKRHDTQTAIESVDGELERMPGTPEFQGHYRNLRTAGIKPAEAAARAATTAIFGEVVTASGMPEKAAAAALQKASTLSVDEVPAFLDKYTKALTSRGLAQPFDGIDNLGTGLQSASDDALEAAIAAAYDQGDVRQTMNDLQALEASTNTQQAQEPRAQAAPESIEPSADLSGGAIDENWSAFTPESGTLNIPRADMPQIKSEHRGALTNFLKARGIGIEQGEVDPDALRPSQSEFSPGKVRRAMGFTGPDRSILVSSDGYVVDGHHQWLAKRESGTPLSVIQFDAPIAELLPIIKKFPSAGVSSGATESTNDRSDAGISTGDAGSDRSGSIEPGFGLAANLGRVDANGRALGAASLDGEQGAGPVPLATADESALNEAASIPQPAAGTAAQTEAAPDQTAEGRTTEPAGQAAAGNQIGDAGLQAAGVVQPRTPSWVLRDKTTKAVVMETFDKKKVVALNTEKYEAVPIREYLASLTNREQTDQEIKQGEITTPRAQAATESVAEQEPIKNPARLGKNNVDLAEGGKPFKTKLAADTARKGQTMMRTVRVEGGYALTEKTEAQIAAQEAAARRMALPQTSPRGEPIPAHAMIAAEGGLSPFERADMGMEGNVAVGNRKLFAGAGRGLSIERALEKLVEDGYLPEGASQDDARNLIKRSLNNPQYTPEGTEFMAERDAKQREDDYNAEQLAIALLEESRDNAEQVAIASFEAAVLDLPGQTAQSDLSLNDALIAAGLTQEEIDRGKNSIDILPREDGGTRTQQGDAGQTDTNGAGRIAQAGEGASQASTGQGARTDSQRDGAAQSNPRSRAPDPDQVSATATPQNPADAGFFYGDAKPERNEALIELRKRESVLKSLIECMGG